MDVILIILGLLGLMLFIGYLGSKSPRFNKALDVQRIPKRKALELNASEASQRAATKRRCNKAVLYEFVLFMKAYQELVDSEDFYNYERNYSDFKLQRGRLRKRRPSEYEISVAIRFCRMEYYYETCDRKIEPIEEKQMQDWQSIEIDVERLFERLLDNFVEYWDDVLESYVRKDARIKRIHYLIERIDYFKKLSGFRESEHIQQRLAETKEYYNKMLPL